MMLNELLCIHMQKKEQKTKNNLDTDLTPLTKKFKMDFQLKCWTKSIKSLEENTEEKSVSLERIKDEPQASKNICKRYSW